MSSVAMAVGAQAASLSISGARRAKSKVSGRPAKWGVPRTRTVLGAPTGGPFN